jgi:hypothetical protein
MKEAYDHIQPMVTRVKENNGLYEWYKIQNKPRGSGTFHGLAGVLFKVMQMFDIIQTPTNSEDKLVFAL